eukprot:gene12191-16332_t
MPNPKWKLKYLLIRRRCAEHGGKSKQGGLVNVGVQMSFIRLSNGRYLIIDTISVTNEAKAEIDHLTESGSLIEAVIATHPFHTLYFKPFQKIYPGVNMYGTPRHIRNIPDVKWEGDVNDEVVRKMWENEGIFMRIPDGAEFVSPVENNHFSGVFVFHSASRTIHINDTIMYIVNPTCLMRFAGLTHGKMFIHNFTSFYPNADAPYQFKSFLEKLINDWDFDNLCCGHSGNKLGGAKHQLIEVIKTAEPEFQKASMKYSK